VVDINKRNFIFCGDVRDLLKEYPENFFDCVISDVPYKIITGGARISIESQEKYGKTDPKGIFNRMVCYDRLKSKWLKQGDADSALLVAEGKLFQHCEIKFEEWLPEVFRVLKDGSHAYFMVNSRNLNELMTKAEAAGFKFMNLLVWAKNNKTPNKYYMQQCEFILFLRKGFAKNINDMGMGNVFTIPNIIGTKFHPTEKPVELMKQFVIQSTKPGETILEPFAGSGSTCVAAVECGRFFVAAELEKRFCEITAERVSGKAKRKEYKKQNCELEAGQAQLQMNLFQQ
jgi:site-specific DNA-methyltransferase (adenine-specific)